MMKKLEKYSFGIGDRFTKQGEAQLKAIIQANQLGIPIVPVWNKSNREHLIVKSEPSDTWREAIEATKALNYKGNWYVDADHINLGSVDRFTGYSNFFTLDVADYIGKRGDKPESDDMLKKLGPFLGSLNIPGIDATYDIDEQLLQEVVDKFFIAIKEAALIYGHIKEVRGNEDFVAEISMDEVDEAQTPVELFFILMMIHHFDIPVQTIAPKFTGRFNKGVDYVGDVELFRQEFEQDLLVIDHVVGSFNLPDNLKLSVHSGSDKFSIYPVIGELIKKHDKGIHVKTAGTTWLEEVIGLAMADGEALDLAKQIYSTAYSRMDELCGPYATVIDIDKKKLPAPAEVSGWDSRKFADTLRHIPGHRDYDPMFRQLIHVGYKVAAEFGEKYCSMLEKHAEIVGEQVTENILERHVKRLFR
ncbi:MAG: tagaturonate epimerase family protein [Bacteroidales bacterium]